MIGSGPIGAEMAQSFARFGSEVTLFDIAPSFMPREDPDAAAIVRDALVRDGVTFRLGVSGMKFAKGVGGVEITVSEDGQSRPDAFDKVLVGVGRKPNVERLDLERVGVKTTDKGIVVNDRLRTTNSRIFACGDVASQFKFTHAADAMARIVIGNALFFATHRASALNIPWATYTDPEIAHVGVYGHTDDGKDYSTIQIPFSALDRAILDSRDEGFLKVHHDRKGYIRGATIVAAHAGELIGELVVAMNHKVRLGSLASDIHPYPTQSEIVKRAGDAYRKTMLTPQIASLLNRILTWRR